VASNKNPFGICDVCGWRYKLNQLKKNSYGLLVCPTDWEGKYDLKNHPQNYSARKTGDDEGLRVIRNENNNDRNKNWEDVDSNWEESDVFCSLI
jgi:hypothetical protein